MYETWYEIMQMSNHVGITENQDLGAGKQVDTDMKSVSKSVSTPDFELEVLVWIRMWFI